MGAGMINPSPRIVTCGANTVYDSCGRWMRAVMLAEWFVDDATNRGAWNLKQRLQEVAGRAVIVAARPYRCQVRMRLRVASGRTQELLR